MSEKSQYTFTVVLYGVLLGFFVTVSIYAPTYSMGVVTTIVFQCGLYVVWFAAGAVENLNQLEITKSNLELLNKLKTPELSK